MGGVLHVAPNGSASNDGLSPSTPVDSLNTALSRLVALGPTIDYPPEVNIAAGVYDGGAAMPYVRSIRRLKISGPSKGGPRITPDVIIRRGNTSWDYGLFTGDGTRVTISDIAFEGFDLDSNSAGVRTGPYSDVTLNNVQCSNNTIGLFALTHTAYTINGCVLTDNGYSGIHELFSVVRNTVAGDDPAQYNVISGSPYGLKAKELCTGHFDRTLVTDCDHAVHLSRSCTVNSEDAIYKRNGIVFAVGPNSAVVANRVIYGAGADRNTVKWRHFQGVGIVRGEIENAVTGPYVGLVEKSMGYLKGAIKGHTGTTSDTKLVDLGASQAGDFQGEGAWYRYEVAGIASLSATAILRIRIGGGGAIAINMPTGSYNWRFEGRVFARSNGADEQRADGVLWVSGGSPVFGGGDRTYSFSTTGFDHALYVQLGQAPDSVSVFQAMSFTSEM